MKFLLLSLFFSLNLFSENVDYYLYINADNDLIDIRPDGSIYHLSHKILKDFKNAKRKSSKIGLHIYHDSLKSETTFQSICNDSFISSTQDETYSLDPVYVNELTQRTCFFENSKKVLILWGHGASWTKGQFDLSHPEKQESFDRFLSQIHGSFDLIIFDACSMLSYETLDILKEKTSFIIASQFNLPGSGIIYSQFLKNNEGLSSIQHFYEEIQKTTMKNNKKVNVFAPLVLIDLKKFEVFKNNLNEFIYSFNLDERDLIDLLNKALISEFRTADDNAMDLRKIIYLYSQKYPNEKKQIDKLIQSLNEILYQKYGSLSISLKTILQGDRHENS